MRDIKMKKQLLLAAALTLFLTGCGSSKAEKKTMKCSMEQTSQGLKINTVQEFDYVDNEVKNQKQVMTAQLDEKTKDVYQTGIEKMKETYKDIEGMSYDGSIDDKNLFTETMTFDFDKISATDYGKATQQTALKGDKVKISLDKSVENLEKQGFKCEE